MPFITLLQESSTRHYLILYRRRIPEHHTGVLCGGGRLSQQRQGQEFAQGEGYAEVQSGIKFLDRPKCFMFPLQSRLTFIRQSD